LLIHSTGITEAFKADKDPRKINLGALLGNFSLISQASELTEMMLARFVVLNTRRLTGCIALRTLLRTQGRAEIDREAA
jgi:hypothetical protein